MSQCLKLDKNVSFLPWRNLDNNISHTSIFDPTGKVIIFNYFGTTVMFAFTLLAFTFGLDVDFYGQERGQTWNGFQVFFSVICVKIRHFCKQKNVHVWNLLLSLHIASNCNFLLLWYFLKPFIFKSFLMWKIQNSFDNFFNKRNILPQCVIPWNLRYVSRPPNWLTVFEIAKEDSC